MLNTLCCHVLPFFVMLNTTPTVMLNLFQHLMELWQSALSSKDPEPSSGGRWVWQGDVSLKAPLTFRHVEHHPLLSC